MPMNYSVHLIGDSSGRPIIAANTACGMICYPLPEHGKAATRTGGTIAITTDSGDITCDKCLKRLKSSPQL
jgi:hypothetical protein